MLAVLDGSGVETECTPVPEFPTAPDGLESISVSSSFTLLSDVKSEDSSTHSLLFESGGLGQPGVE